MINILIMMRALSGDLMMIIISMIMRSRKMNLRMMRILIVEEAAFI